ncbi:hypothetical protein L6452_15639 [Arctium lappa]|uniref:Uncharacterized protein n=1 Tax=Arctium lappa TaxID=4217 RepID=A0ACB9CPE8_ARCLA|nr:hypothetical protein L6452_15639 [Arctium lappa]
MAVWMASGVVVAPKSGGCRRWRGKRNRRSSGMDVGVRGTLDRRGGWRWWTAGFHHEEERRWWLRRRWKPIKKGYESMQAKIGKEGF